MILYFNLTSFTLWTLCFLLLSGFCKDINGQTTSDYERLQPYNENPYYWQYKGKPILLIAGSDYHNIFQRPDLVEHLDLLKSIGGNYIRNTMASREIFADHRDLWPFEAVEVTEDSLINIYDLAKWNDAYWENFEKMLVETLARDMIVEVTIWERHDFYRTRDQAGWIRQPYNPANNINYTADGGEAEIVLEGNARFVQVQWLDIESSWWGGGGTSQTEETLTISPPGEGHWIGIVTLIQ
jgi:hypothetical protein